MPELDTLLHVFAAGASLLTAGLTLALRASSSRADALRRELHTVSADLAEAQQELTEASTWELAVVRTAFALVKPSELQGGDLSACARGLRGWMARLQDQQRQLHHRRLRARRVVAAESRRLETLRLALTESRIRLHQIERERRVLLETSRETHDEMGSLARALGASAGLRPGTGSA